MCAVMPSTYVFMRMSDGQKEQICGSELVLGHQERQKHCHVRVLGLGRGVVGLDNKVLRKVLLVYSAA